MANTYQLIASNTLGSAASSITFSSIPATYTDLVIRISARTDRSATTDIINITVNGSSSSIYSFTYLSGDGASATSSRDFSTDRWQMISTVDGNTATSNTFNSGELYIPNYAGSTNKPASIFAAQENNNTTAYISATAALFSSTSAITSLTFVSAYSSNFLATSSFYLYGIKNS